MSNQILIGTRKGLFVLEQSGGRWHIARTAFLADNVNMLLPDGRDGALYATIHHGHFGDKLHRSRDGAKTWEEIGVPTYPQPQPGEEDKNPWTGAPLPWKLNLIWALEAGGPQQPGLLWCGTIPGGLFRSQDHGASWELVRSLWDHPKRKAWFGGGADLPGIHSICVHPRDANHLTLGVSCGGVWVTTDGAASWNCRAEGMWASYMPPEQKNDPNVQDPHRVVQCPTAPDHLWAQHHNGVFRSTNGSASWEEIKDVPPSVFGFAVAVHPRDPNTAWLVPGISDEKRIPPEGKVVVTRTRDGGRTFEVLRKGLPQEHAYDLTFRHALDVDETGDCLAFGSTTGGVWTSNDGGDSWQCVSEHLPPVYCVRFVKKG